MRRIEQFLIPATSWAYRHMALFGALCLAAYIAAVGAVSWVAPGANWDMLAYTASIIEARTSDVGEIHSQAYGAVRDRVSEGEYLELTGDRPYRVAQAADPAAFATMLGFYRVKVVYVALATWLSEHMQPVDALRAISSVSFAVIGLVILVWAAERRMLASGPLIIALLVLCGLGEAARIVTPDLFAGIFVIAALLLFVRGNDWASALAMFAGCLSRPDHLALAAAMLFAAIVFRRGIVPQTVAFVASAAATAWLSQGTGHPGWWIQLWFSYVEFVPTLEGFDPPFSIVTYAGIIVEVIVRSLTNEAWLAIVIAQIAAAIMLLWQGWRPDRRIGAVLVALLLTELGKLFVAPQAETRTHIAYTIVGGLLLIEAIVRFTSGRGRLARGEHAA